MFVALCTFIPKKDPKMRMLQKECVDNADSHANLALLKILATAMVEIYCNINVEQNTFHFC